MRLESVDDLINRAVTRARESVEHHNQPFGAVAAARHGQASADGWNEVVTAGDPLAHAELQALRRFCRRERPSSPGSIELYSSCEPCVMCLAAAVRLNVAVIYYAVERSVAERYGFPDCHGYRNVASILIEGSGVNANHWPVPGGERPFELWAEMTGGKKGRGVH